MGKRGHAMNRSGKTRLYAHLFLLSTLFMGCSSLNPAKPTPELMQAQKASPSRELSPLRQTAFQTSADIDSSTIVPRANENAFSGMDQLSVDALVQQVLVRNPSLAQMVAAWQAASARYPQVTSLDDPMFGAAVAPASIGSEEVDFGYRLEISQRFPFPGKLRLRGENALAEASAAGNEVPVGSLMCRSS
jgi:cobalt-zinc-cadmium efflux system outer membrane protein